MDDIRREAIIKVLNAKVRNPDEPEVQVINEAKDFGPGNAEIMSRQASVTIERLRRLDVTAAELKQIANDPPPKLNMPITGLIKMAEYMRSVN